MLFKNNLQKRTLLYSYSVIGLCRSISETELIKSCLVQLIRSSTSVGANYHESMGSVSRKEMIVKTSICLKEANESLYWLLIVLKFCPAKSKEVLILKCETVELIKIFTSIIRKLMEVSTSN